MAMRSPLTDIFDRLMREKWARFHEKQEILLLYGKDDLRLDQEFWDMWRECGPPLASDNWREDGDAIPV
jgi:hypothetical protein